MTKSPTVRLSIGLLFTVAAVTVFCSYSLHQLAGLRKLQTNTIDMNRHDSLLLLRVQNDLNTIALNLRDFIEADEKAHIADFESQFLPLRTDLEDSIQMERRIAPVIRKPERQEALLNVLQHFHQTSDRIFAEAHKGQEAQARDLISTELSREQSELARSVSMLLERNNEAEERADQRVSAIYQGVERDIYAFLVATIGAILITSLYGIYSNRRIFQKVQFLSRQRRVLAARLITVQEEVLRSVSRELHDEFGQILTAVGAMLGRAERRGVPPDSPLRTELSEVRQITHNTLEKMRSLSQMLHPAVLDDYGLAKGVEWYADVFAKQTGIETHAFIGGEVVEIKGQPAIHCFRIIQEALNNAAKHSGTKRAEVQLNFLTDVVQVEIRDFGKGIVQNRKEKRGLGLIAMQERAEILSGTLEIAPAEGGGTLVTLVFPLRQDETAFEAADKEVGTEDIGREVMTHES